MESCSGSAHLSVGQQRAQKKSLKKADKEKRRTVSVLEIPLGNKERERLDIPERTKKKRPHSDIVRSVSFNGIQNFHESDSSSRKKKSKSQHSGVQAQTKGNVHGNITEESSSADSTIAKKRKQNKSDASGKKETLKKKPKSKGEKQKEKEKVKKSKKQSKTSGKQQKITTALSTESDDLIHTTWKLNADDIARLKTRGITIRMGRWTQEEEKILKQNMQEYLDIHNIEDPATLIFAYKDNETEEGRSLQKFASNTGFYRHLAKGICRSVFLVYRRVIRSYDEHNYKGKFSREETKELKWLQRIHGNDWVKIGGNMGRSSLSVQHKFSHMQGTRGPWTDEEISALQEGVRAVTSTNKGEAVYKVCWKSVASFVKTRNTDQCRVKWLDEICWKEKQHSNRKWTKEDDMKLLERVYNSPATVECDLDWGVLADGFEGARSPQWLQRKWWQTKQKYCSSHALKTMDFEELVDYLYNTKGVDLRNKYGRKSDKAIE